MATLDAGTAAGTRRARRSRADRRRPPSAGQDLARRGGLAALGVRCAEPAGRHRRWDWSALVALFCFLGPLFYRTNQVTVQLNLATLPPGAAIRWAPTPSGYDVLGRLMLGGQSSLELGFAVAWPPRSSARSTARSPAWPGGIVDTVMMRVIDTLLAIPSLVLLLILVNLFTPNLCDHHSADHDAVLARHRPAGAGRGADAPDPGVRAGGHG